MRSPLMLAGVVLAVALALAGARLAGYAAYVVVSRSMEPTVPAGAVIVVQASRPEDVRVGDVITFTLPDRVVTHRVEGISSSTSGIAFTTHGDANAAPDPWLVRPDRSAGVVRATVPLLGFFVAAIQAWWRLLAVMLLAWLAIDAAIVRLGADRRRHAPQVAAP